MKLNILAINPNRMLFSPSEVKMLESEPSFFSFNIIDQVQRNRQNSFCSTYFSLCDFRGKKGRKIIAELNGIGHPTNLISLYAQFLFNCVLSRNSSLPRFTKDIAYCLWFCLVFCQQAMTLCLVFSTLLCKQTFLLTHVIYLLYILYSTPNINPVQSRRMRWSELMARVGDRRGT
jgi:hypothetical protein